MKFDHLKTFYIVAKVGSLTKAAEELNLDQSSISRKIGDLEVRLKTKLFNRISRGVTLTPQGEVLYNEAKEILSRLEGIKSAVKDAGAETPHGVLKVASTLGFTSLYLSPFLKEFYEKFPKIRLGLLTTDTLPAVEIGEASALIHPYIPYRDDLIQVPLVNYHMRLYASPEYIEKYGAPKKPEDLDHHKLISYGSHHNHYFDNSNWLLSIGKKAHAPREPVMEINTTSTRARVGEDGLGIVSIPREHPGLDKMNLVRILPKIEGPRIQIFYVFSRQLENSVRIKCFGAFLKEKIGNIEK